MVALTIRQLEYFVAIAELGSLTAAARRLHITPGSLSSALSDLEKELGVKVLVRRRAKGATLTAAGRQLVVKAQEVLAAAEGLTSEAGAIRGELVGTLRLGCFGSLSPWLIPAVLDYFGTKYPRVDVEIVESSSDELQAGLLSGALDAAFMYMLHVSAPLEHTTITPVRLQLVLPAAHRLARQRQIQLAELGDDPAILLGLRPAPDLVDAMTSAAGFHPNVRWRSTNVETIRSVVGRGLAYSMIMGRPLGDRTYEGNPLVYRRIADEMPQNSVELVYPAGGLTDAKVRALADFSREHLQEATVPMQQAGEGP